CFSVIFVLIALMVSAQDKTVSGTVIDETGEPVIGATVMVKGSKVGIATDIDGKYTLNTPPTVF
ncbi:carboxypeptidase-like regulatory domain-containing protein, partial [uncultured Duncaniella sp.]